MAMKKYEAANDKQQGVGGGGWSRGVCVLGTAGWVVWWVAMNFRCGCLHGFTDSKDKGNWGTKLMKLPKKRGGGMGKGG